MRERADRTARRAAPYVMIWGAAALALATVSRGAPCTDVCAVYLGSLLYVTAALAVLLTALVAAAQLVVTGRLYR